LLDFYRGRITMRRMVLLVVHDLGRMPRTKAAVQGLPPGRPWDETHALMALQYTVSQALLRVAWIQASGYRVDGAPPDVKPYPMPQPKGAAAAERPVSQARKPDPRAMKYLNRFAPPDRRKHLTLVKTPPAATE
jgi:hypothetical protein